MVIDGVAHGSAAVQWECDAGVFRIVVGRVLTETVSAAVRELLLDACERGTHGVVLVVEAELEPGNHDVLRHLVDVAQRRCWAASRRFEVVATDPEICEALATAGIWPSPPTDPADA
ncbi:hypothetical protein [Kribbella ginsengisoli]|uniref:hypothetical protein n=1 Tax=Kribbella ginsengisoli TaxID=363865 RepID=UPI0031DBBFF0